MNTPSPRLELFRSQSQHEAIGLISFLAQYTTVAAERTFAKLHNEIYSAVIHKQYAIVGMPYQHEAKGEQTTPIGYILWGMFSPMTLSLHQKAIRDLAPSEYKSGELCAITQLGTPFGMRREIFEFVREHNSFLKTQKPFITFDLQDDLPQDGRGNTFDLMTMTTSR